MSWRAPLRNNAVSTSVPVSSGCERTFKVVLAMAYHSTVGYFLVETINRIRHLLFSSYTTNDYSSGRFWMNLYVFGKWGFIFMILPTLIGVISVFPLGAALTSDDLDDLVNILSLALGIPLGM